MSEPIAETSTLESELDNLIHKHGLDTRFASSKVLARYLIRQLDNFRETQQELDRDYANYPGVLNE